MLKTLKNGQNDDWLQNCFGVQGCLSTFSWRICALSTTSWSWKTIIQKVISEGISIGNLNWLQPISFYSLCSQPICKRKGSILSLGWLPIPERRIYNLLKLAHKAIYREDWPEYLQVERHVPARLFRSSGDTQLSIRTLVSGTFQQACTKTFNELPSTIRNCSEHGKFFKSPKRPLERTRTE